VGHLVFREFFGFSSNLPKWLDEGVAVWGEDVKHVEVGNLIQPQYLSEESIPFESFLTMNNYPASPALFYAQSYSVVKFLVTQYPTKNFIKFIKALSLQQPLQVALSGAFEDEFLDVGDFEATWKEWLIQESNQRS